MKRIGIILAPGVMLTNAVLGTELNRPGHFFVVALAGVFYAAGVVWERQRDAHAESARD